jgi:hypothetical protein
MMVIYDQEGHWCISALTHVDITMHSWVSGSDLRTAAEMLVTELNRRSIDESAI